MKRYGKRLSLLINVVLVAFIAQALWRHVRVAWSHSELIDVKIGKLRVLTAGGEDVLVPSKADESSVLVFWASWCTPCTLELARIREAVDEGEIEASRIYAVAIGETPEVVRQTAAERHYNFQVYADPSGMTAELLRVEATPTIVYLGSGHAIREFDTGITPFLVSKIQDHLAQ